MYSLYNLRFYYLCIIGFKIVQLNRKYIGYNYIYAYVIRGLYI